MTDPRRGAWLLGLGTTALLLAGCASPAPASTEAAPDESGAPAAATAPSFRLGITCDDLLDTATVQAQLSSPVSLRVDETSVPSNWYDVNFAQVGGLHCAWGGDAMTDQFSDIGYEVWIRPDAQSDFDTWYDSQQPTLDNQCIGDTSFPCRTGWTFQNSWVSTYMSDAVQDPTATSLAYSALNNAVDARLDGLPLADAWQAPAAGVDQCAEPAASDRAVQALERDPDTMMPPQFGPQLDVTTTGGPAISCGWYDSETGAQLLTVDQVPGGGWAFAAMQTQAPEPFLIEPMAATPIPGADVAYVGCGDGCAALVKVGDDFVQLATGEFERDAWIGVVSRWVAGL